MKVENEIEFADLNKVMWSQSKIADGKYIAEISVKCLDKLMNNLQSIKKQTKASACGKRELTSRVISSLSPLSTPHTKYNEAYLTESENLVISVYTKNSGRNRTA